MELQYTTLTCLVGSSFRRKRPCLKHCAVCTLTLSSTCVSYGTYDDLGLSAPPKISPAGLEGIRSRVVARGPVKEEHRTAHFISYQISPLGSVTRPLSKGCLLSGAPQPDHVSAKLRKCPSQRPLPRCPPRLRMASSTFDLGSTRDSAQLTYLWIPLAIQESRDSRPLPCSYAFCSRKYFAIQFLIHELDPASSSLA